MRKLGAFALLAYLFGLPAFAQAPPPIPPIPDATRSATYNITSSTAQISVPFAVFGDCTDISVIINSVPVSYPTSVWSCASASGFALSTLPLPITDMVINFTPPLTSGTLTITGAWHPRNLTVPTASGLSRREYEQAISTLIAGNRENFDALAQLGSVPPLSNYLTNYFAVPPPLGTTPNAVGASTLTTGTLSVGAPNLVGDGVTDNSVALQAALTAAANGGYIQLPCGVYKITASMTVTIASGKKIFFEGSGEKCTKIAVSGAVNGLVFFLSDETAAVDLKDFTLTTDQPGTQFGIILQNTNANVLFAFAAASSVTNVAAFGSDYPNGAGPTKYWAWAITLSNVNNISTNNTFFMGGGCVSSACNGGGYNIVGKGSGSYGVVFNINSAFIGLCNIGIAYGDWIQGVSLVNTNITGCQQGITVVQLPAGVLAQLTVVNSQFNNLLYDIYANTGASGALANLQLVNDLFYSESSTTGEVILRNVVEYAISGNTFNGFPGGTGIEIVNSANDGTISGNSSANLTTAFKVDASATLLNLIVAGNQWKGNTTDISVGAGVTGLIIRDDFPRTIAGLFSCLAGLDGSRAYVSDTTGAAAPTYHLAVAGSGATTVHSPVYCDGSTPAWKYD